MRFYLFQSLGLRLSPRTPPSRNLQQLKSVASANSRDFADIVSKVQEKAKQLREAAISRPPFKWKRSSSIQQLPRQVLEATLGPSLNIPEAVKANSLGFGFSAGGMLFPYYIGVLEGLTRLGLATEATHIAGASAGSIIAVCHHSGISTDVIAAACLEVAEDCRVNGTRGRLGADSLLWVAAGSISQEIHLQDVLEKFLVKLLPEDIHDRCKAKTFIAVTKAFPRPKGELVSQWTSKNDLIQTILTSCHIPWWFDSTLMTQFRGSQYYDGGLTNFIPVPPDVMAGIHVCCFPAKQISSVYNIQISPDNFEDWPYTMSEMLGWAFEPAEEDVLLQFISKGRADAQAWALSSGAAAALKEINAAKSGLESEQYPALKPQNSQP